MEHIVALPHYDILAYLIAGFAAIAGLDLVYRTSVVFRSDWSIPQSTMLVIAAFITGQMLASFSALVLEGWIVQPPTKYLMGQPCKDGKWDLAYFEPLGCHTQEKIRGKAEHETASKHLQDQDLFWEAYNKAKQDNDAFERIVTFHQIYNFSRNTSFAAAILAILALWRRPRREHAVDWLPKWIGNQHWLAAVFAGISVVMFFRYLYFYRAHAIEVLTSYAYGN